jgi:hypothetical protein
MPDFKYGVLSASARSSATSASAPSPACQMQRRAVVNVGSRRACGEQDAGLEMPRGEHALHMGRPY